MPLQQPAHGSQWTRPLLGGSAAGGRSRQPTATSTTQTQAQQLQQREREHLHREHREREREVPISRKHHEHLQPDEPARIKVVLVGDGAVGKTSLIVSYSTNGFPPEYEPTAFDNYNVVVNVDGQPINIQLCDTAGQDDFDPLRSLCYPETDVFLICFSIVSPTSYHSVATKWINEVHRHCPNTPVILVGTKSDLRSDVRLSLQLARYGQAPITTIQGHQLAHRIGASSYVETSALTQQDLKEAFDQAIVSALSVRRGGAKFLTSRRKPPSLWRRWLCCWERSSSSSSSRA